MVALLRLCREGDELAPVSFDHPVGTGGSFGQT